ncbi:MAG: rhomboid family intramembrane serine protease [Verrucomicrobia bacterium]|nr:rhomboid family intramembrane serine protease [Verrucomicrobiota bacterium]
MLSDRDYMREEDNGMRFSWTVMLLIALVVVFVAEAIAETYLSLPLQEYGALSNRVWRSGWVWQLVTFQFLHGSFAHLFFNGLGVWMFGRPIEAAFGGRRMMGLWMAGGLVGGLLQLGISAAFPDVFSPSVVGASAGLMTFLAIFCRLEPDARILLALIVPVPARFLFYFSVGVAVFFIVVPSRDGVAHAAHLGGLLFGWFWVQAGYHRGEGLWDRLSEGWHRWNQQRQTSRPASRAAVGQIIKPSFRSDSAPTPAKELSNAEFMAREVDPILDKIARDGISSLTEAERQTLEAARKKVTRR